MGTVAYHVLGEEGEALQSAHGLRRRVDVAEDDMGLAPHLGSLEGDDIEDDAIGREQHVQVPLEVFLGELVGEVAQVQSASC
jgi:hypothetical protein